MSAAVGNLREIVRRLKAASRLSVMKVLIVSAGLARWGAIRDAVNRD